MWYGLGWFGDGLGVRGLNWFGCGLGMGLGGLGRLRMVWVGLGWYGMEAGHKSPLLGQTLLGAGWSGGKCWKSAAWHVSSNLWWWGAVW